MTRVTLLILAHLGLVACTKDGTPPADDPSGRTNVPTGANTGEAPPGDPPDKSCKTNEECGGGWMYCQKEDPNKDGKCAKRPSLGRPLVIDGAPHVAPHPALHELLDAAHEEHASIAAFARTIAELMALGAPLWLIRETQDALADEIRHTEVSLSLVSRLTGQTHVIAPLPAATAPLARSTEEFFRDVFRGGAVGETLAAARAATQKETATDDELRAFYEMIVVDESRHAALAFKTLRWLMAREPDLARVFAEEQDAAPAELGPIFASLKESRVRDRESVTAWV
jgi:hypothetical protein